MKPAERELLCQNCGRDYPVWFTVNELWNAVTDHKSEKPEIQFLCLNCFAFLAEEKTGRQFIWELRQAGAGSTAPPTTVPKPKAKIGEVWRNLESGVVFVVRRIAMVGTIAGGGYEKVADTAHENDDFSYQCGKPFCRCMQ